MIYLNKVNDNTNEIDYTFIISKKGEHIQKILNTWNKKSKVFEFNNLLDFYNFIKKEKNINLNKTILFLKSPQTEKNNLKEYKNLLTFYLFYQKEVTKIEKEISKWNKTFINKTDNKLVKEAMENFVSLNSNGKYIRALLIAIGYYISHEKEDDLYLPLSAAYETFQTSILIHDDVIDNADLRRGNKTINRTYKDKFNSYKNKSNLFNERKKDTANSIGICLGDIGFFITNNMILESYTHNPNLQRLLKCFNDIVINTGKGELIDVILPFNEQYNKNNKCSEKDIMEIYNLKTSYYTIVGPCSLGLILGGSNDKILNSIRETLTPIGTAFQIKDDILGIFGNEKTLGKSNKSDIEEYKQTILYSYVINKTKYKKELKKYYGKTNLKEKDLYKVRNIIETSGAKKYATKKMNKLFEESKLLVSNNKNIPSNYKEILLGFITFLEIRKK